MLKGESIDLKLVERDELPILYKWFNDPGFTGRFEPVEQTTKTGLEKQYDELKDANWFFINLKDGSPIGFIANFKRLDWQVIGYYLVDEERGKGYGSEAVKMIVDYVFMLQKVVRIQAETHPDNIASQRVLLKNGFKKEGVIRKSFFSRGVWRDTVLFSIIRDEWGGPHYDW